MLKPPFKYYGGKFYLSKWIISHFPEHTHYIEGFGGAGSCILNKTPAGKDVLNDIDSHIFLFMNFIKHDLNKFLDFVNTIECTEANYYAWKAKTPDNDLEEAAKFFIIYRMSRCGCGGSFSKSKRFYRGLPENVAAWQTGIKNLAKIHERLQTIELWNRNVFDIIPAIINDDTLIYLDPPYVLASRSSKKVYEHEFTNQDHEEFCELCKNSSAKIIISGYNNEIYTKSLKDWNYVEKESWLHSAHAAKKKTKTEILWKNF
jgi:DNA adenine methylase